MAGLDPAIQQTMAASRTAEVVADARIKSGLTTFVRVTLSLYNQFR